VHEVDIEGIFTTSVFDTTSGVYTLNTNDESDFVPGVYTFKFTATIGLTVAAKEFTLIVGNPLCELTYVNIVTQPPTLLWYFVEDAEINVYTYNSFTVVNTDNTFNCGEPIMEWLTPGGFTLPEFIMEDCVGLDCELDLQTDDFDWAGDHQFFFRYYYTGRPSIMATSTTVKVRVVNRCLPPSDCFNIPECGIPMQAVSAPTDPMTLTVTASIEGSIELPPWTVTLPACASQIVPSCPDCMICCPGCNCGTNGPDTGFPVVIVDHTVTVHVTTCQGYCIDSMDGQSHIVTINGCLGTACAQYQLTVVILNPCIDPVHLDITEGLVPEFSYQLYT
jgi:hypothetical protein